MRRTTTHSCFASQEKHSDEKGANLIDSALVHPTCMRARWKSRLPLVAILAVAVAVRLTGIGFGRGLIGIHPDEGGVTVALRELHAGRPSFYLFAYGGGYIIPLYAFLRLWILFGWPNALAPPPMTLGDFAGVFDVILPGRFWSVLLSSLTVWLVYLTGKRIARRETGLLAAAFLAASNLAVRDAHMAKADSAATFCMALVLFGLAYRWAAPTRRAWILGMIGGLALSTKYLVGALPALLWRLATPMSAQRQRRIDGRGLALGLIAIGLTFLAFNPYWLASPGRAYTSLQALLHSQSWLMNTPSFRGTSPGPAAYHARISLRHGCGLAFALLSLPALLLGLYRSGTPRLIALVGLGHAIVICANPLLLARNFEPIVPVLSVLIALLVSEALDRLRFVGARRMVVAVLIGTAVVAEPLHTSILWGLRMREPDTRQLAADWIASNVPADVGVVTFGGAWDALDWGMPVECFAWSAANPDRLAIKCALSKVRLYSRLPRTRWRENNVGLLYWYNYPLPFSQEPLPPEASGGELLATFDPFGQPRREVIVEPYDAFYFPLDGIDGVKRPGPLIQIYRLPSDARPAR